MFKLSTLVDSKKPNRQGSLKLSRPKKKSKAKPQASKKQSREAVELEWLKQVITRKVATVFIVVAVIISAVLMLPKDDFLPIEKIIISGDYEQLNMERIKNNLDNYLGQGFFSVDIKYIQRNLSREPWIDTISVKRIWPDKLHVSLKEKQAIARWDGKHLLSDKAVIFSADSKTFTHLPRINGYSGQSVELLNRYGEIQYEFSKLGIHIAEMIEDSKGALSLVLNGKLKVSLGSENNDLKIKKLLSVYSDQIKPRAEHIKHIDFRYSNGFAIAWTDQYLNLKKSGDSKKRGNKNV